MKNKKAFLVNLIFAIVWLGFAVLLTVYAINVLRAKVALAIIFSVLGLVIHYFVALAFHEWGHVLFAKKNGMKLNYVNFGFFSVDYTKEKKRVKFFTFFGEHAGESVFLPHKGMTKEKLCSIAFGGLLFSFLFALLGVLAILCISNWVAFCLLGIASVPSTYLLIVNSLTIDKTSDGSLIFSGGDYGDVLVAVIKHEGQAEKGIIPSCPTIFQKSKQPLARFYYYKHLIVREKFKEANSVLIDLSGTLSRLTEDEYQLIFPEVVYSECIRKKVSEESKLLAESFFIGGTADIATVRAHREYRKFIGEDKWAETLNKTYERMLKASNKFTKEYEKRLNEQSDNVKKSFEQING